MRVTRMDGEELAGGGANSFIKASVTPQSMAERTRHRSGNSSSISTSLRRSLKRWSKDRSFATLHERKA